MNELEAQLRSWTPRRPSASLERSLFARRPGAAELPPAFRRSWLGRRQDACATSGAAELRPAFRLNWLGRRQDACATPGAAELPPAFRLSWLAPATAALLLAGLFLSARNSTVIGSANTVPMVAMILSNQSAAAYLSGTLPRAENRLPADTYQWTLRGGATSVISAVLDPRKRK